MESSIYRPLLFTSSIRLLEIEPEASISKVRCRLVQVASLYDECPTFEALSYVWGSPVRSRTISCNDQDFTVTESLHSALCCLRLPDRSRRIWADAICINQDDLDERNQQVRIMKNIYAAAEKVCVWLGPDTDGDVEKASILMAAIVQTCEVNARNRGQQYDKMTDEERFKLSDLPLLGWYGDNATHDTLNPSADSVAQYWKALRNFFSRSWFTRVWCVQETVVARDSIVMCGDVDIPWRVVELTAMWLDTQQTYYDHNVPSLIVGIDAFNALMICYEADPELRCNTLINALKTFLDFKATDPRDKVYAILGISQDHGLVSRIPISYERSVARIYVEVVEAALDTQRDLLVLACVQHADTFEPNPDFPSWTPRWDTMVANASMITSDVGVLDFDFDWDASRGRGLDTFTVEHSNGTLSLHGVVFDTLVFLSEKMDYKDFDSTSLSPNPSVILSIWKRFIDPHTTTLEGIAKITTLALALTCETDVDHDHVGDSTEIDDRYAFFTDFFAYIMHLHDLEDMQLAERQALPNSDEVDREEDVNQPKEGDTRPSSFPLENGDWKRYATAASRVCDQRRFFVTSRGFMGLGPASTQKGDFVVVLFGGRVPFMLRRMDLSLFATTEFSSSSKVEREETERHYLIGEAFVQDIMRGEVIDGLNEGQFKEEEFKLI